MKKKIKWFLYVFIYMLFCGEIVCIYATMNTCTLEHNIDKKNNIPLIATTNEYLYDIEQGFVDENDLYRLVNISGWLAQKDDNKYVPVKADLIIESENNIYQADLYTTKRLDVYYLDQSQSNNKDLYIGWFTKFPAINIENGIYRIGFLVKENEEEKVLWTDNYITIVWDDVKKTDNIIDFINQIKNKKNYIIFIAVKDEGSRALTEEVIYKFRELGLSFELAGRHRWSYLAVLDNGKVVYENTSKEKIEFAANIDSNNVFLYSAGFDCGNDSSIKINGDEYAINTRGINIVLFDKRSNCVVDSICVDSFLDNSISR